MNDKLELKHIAGYLPYGLKVEHIDYDYSDKVGKKIVEVVFLAKDCIGFNDGADYYFHPEDIDDYNPIVKPLLRPMSDLYKPCLDGGKIPIEIIGKIFEPKGILLHEDDNLYSYGWNIPILDDYQGYCIGWRDKDNWFGLYYDEYHFESQESCFTGDLLEFNLKVAEFLDENHFDWKYNLIGKGLALDINTIQ